MNRLALHTLPRKFIARFAGGEYTLKADFNAKKLIYPANTSNDTNRPNGIIIHDDTTSNFSHPENFVVFECVHRLLQKGYKPEHIELEPRWNLGRDAKGGKADILVRDNEGNPYLLIECKTTDSKSSEFRKEWARMQNDGGQLFSYFQQERSVKFLCLYTSDFVDNVLNYQSHIIATQDNQSYLKDNSLTGYAHATNATELYEVWKEVYKFDFSTIGIFERNINAYQAGQNALCFEDLQELSSYKDEGKTYEDGKYHEFAKILRKYNISGKENAFDKLVNLFLCKIYDESHHKRNLQFCYRGVTSDSFEAMQDRLMLLYKKAMKELLNEDITYISDEQIETQFSDFKRHKIKTKHLKEQMQEFIRQLKFYSHSDFSFIEVHNKRLFYQNGEVLKAVVKLFESLKLTQNKTNQLLGNLFELFLQKGMKQDEGQFFTPMPICEFIIHSLPLESMLKDSTPKVIDYACGAGHFLNTYANTLTQILPNDKQKQERLDALFDNIYGIEKEYRISKVAKVAAAMFSQEKIHITYADALDFAKFPHDDFDILLSNPPYSVKGFAETISKDSYAKYELSQKVSDTEKFDGIECFFVERANALLSSNAILAIILPSSILNKGGIYENTREIILRNFDIVAIVELGNRTFGATGTNTIILFATKRQTYATSKDSQSYLNLKENIADSLGFDNVYLSDFLRSYCAFMGYDEVDFMEFLGGTINENLAKNFSEYKKVFLESNELKNLQKSKIYKDSNNKDSLQQAEFANFALKKEKEKILYFSLSYQNEVLIVKSSNKSPNDNKEQKKFLGYEWSERKGDEGLKELNIPYTTPLFERENPNNPHKINTLIKNAFLNSTDNEIPKELEKYAFKARLVDMIDFSRADFSKAINLNLSNTSSQSANPFANSKFKLVRLGEVCDINKFKNQISADEIENMNLGFGNVKLLPSSQNYDWLTNEETAGNFLNEGEVIALGVARYANIKKCKGKFVSSNNKLISIKQRDKDKILFDFVYEILAIYGQRLYKIGSQYPQFDSDLFENFQIPLPPIEIQKQIVSECQKVEQQSQNINDLIALCEDLISAILGKCGICDIDAPLPSLQESALADSWQSTDAITALLDLISKGESDLKSIDSPLNKDINYHDLSTPNLSMTELTALLKSLPTPPKNGWERVKLENLLLSVNRSVKIPKSEFLDSGKYPIVSQESDNKINGWTNTENPITDLPVVIFGDHSCSFKFIDFPFFSGADGTQILKFCDKCNTKFMFYILQETQINNQEKYERHFKYLKQVKIPLPPLSEQNKIIAPIEWIESKITALNSALHSIESQKSSIIRKYIF